MLPAKDSDKSIQPSWHCTNVWAKPEQFEGNVVKQLMVPASRFTQVDGVEGALKICNAYGSWPAAAGQSPLRADQIWARLAVGSKPGDALARAEWISRTQLAASTLTRSLIATEVPSVSPRALKTPQAYARRN